MKAINVMLSNLDGKVIPIGYEGENMYTRVRINCVEIFTEYPDATVSMVISPPTGSMYPAVIEKSGVMVVWDITKSILSSNGSGSAQLTFKDGETEIKSVIFGLSINRSLIADGEPPEPVQEWIDRAEETAEEIATRAAENVVENWDQMVSDVADLKEDVERIDATINAQGIFVETESQPIVSIADGADGMPVRKVEVAIEPVQDLHGYDAPWPANGGVNKFGDYTVVNGYIASDGKIYSGNNDRIYVIPIQPSTGYAYKIVRTVATGSTDNDDVQIGEFYNDSRPVTGDIGARLVANGYVNNLRTGTFTTSANAKWLAVKVGNTTKTNIEATVGTIQVEVGSSVSETYSPYSNICPISGHSSATVTRTGVNVWDEEWELGYISLTTGANASSNNCIRSKNYIESAPQKTFFFNCPSASGVNGKVVFYDKNKNFISFKISANNTFDTPAGCEYMRFYMADAYGATYANDISINYPATDTAYHTYQGISVQIPLGQTVYGGTLDVVSGKLVVDKAESTIADLVSSNFAVGQYTCVRRFTLKSPAIPCVSGSTHGAIASFGKEWPAYYGSPRPNEPGSVEVNFAITPDGTLLAIYDKDLTLTETTYMEKYGNQQVCYPLATPIEYTLTPQEIKTLLGANNIWADAGNVAITYPADMKLYIDRKITEAVANALNA